MLPKIRLLIPGSRRRRSAYCVLLLAVPILIIFRSSYPSQVPNYFQIEDPRVQSVEPQKDNHVLTTPTDDLKLHSGPVAEPDDSLCKPTECMDGLWVPRDPPFRSIADFRREYPPTHRGIFKVCGSEETKREQEDRDGFHKAQEERLIQAMNWVWKPTKGRMRKWDAVEFVVRLLRSPGGLILSGGTI